MGRRNQSPESGDLPNTNVLLSSGLRKRTAVGFPSFKNSIQPFTSILVIITLYFIGVSMGFIFTRAGTKDLFFYKARTVFTLVITFFCLDFSYALIDGGQIDHEIKDDQYMYEYEPGMDFEKKSVTADSSMQSLFPSSAISIKANGTKGQVTTLTLDGGPSSHTRMAFDGHVIDFAQIPIFDAQLLPLDLLSDVEIYKFNFSALGISASSGLINYKINSSSDKTMDISLSSGSFATYTGKILLNLGKDSLLKNILGISYNQSGNVFQYLDEFNNTNMMQNMDYKKVSLIHKLTGQRFALSSSFNWKEAGSGDMFSTSARQEDILFISGLRSTDTNFSFSANYSYWLNKYEDLPQTDKHENHQINLDYKKSVTKKFYTLQISSKSQTSYLSSTKMHEVWDEELVLAMENTLSLNDLTIKIDLANNYSVMQGYAFIPAVGTSIKIHPLIILDFRASKVFQRPSFNDLFWPSDSWSEGNPDLQAEQGWKYKLGSRMFFHPFKFQLSFALSDLDELILWTSTTGKWKPENQGQSLIYHSHFSLDYTTVINRLLFQINSSLSWNKSLNNDPSSLYFEKMLLYSPEFKAQLSFHLRNKEVWNSSIYIRYTGSRYITEANTVSLPPYLLVDLHFQYSLVFININNVLNQNTEEIQGYPQPGINFNTGINIKI